MKFAHAQQLVFSTMFIGQIILSLAVKAGARRGGGAAALPPEAQLRVKDDVIREKYVWLILIVSIRTACL